MWHILFDENTLPESGMSQRWIVPNRDKQRGNCVSLFIVKRIVAISVRQQARVVRQNFLDNSTKQSVKIHIV